MNFFKQPELDILNSYPLNKTIPVSDYLCDFVLRNPLNFPFTSYIMKRSTNLLAGDTIKDYYKKDNVKLCLSKITEKYSSDDMNDVFYDMLHSNNISFTGTMLIMFKKYPASKIMIHQYGPDIIISYIDGVHKTVAMFDKSGSSLMIYTTADSVNVYPMFSGVHWNSVAEISQKADIAKHYYFEFVDETDNVKNVVVFLSALTGKVPPSWYGLDLKESCRYKMRDSLMDDYDIIKICSSDFECIEDALVERNVSSDSIEHTETVSNLDVLSKALA